MTAWNCFNCYLDFVECKVSTVQTNWQRFQLLSWLQSEKIKCVSFEILKCFFVWQGRDRHSAKRFERRKSKNKQTINVICNIESLSLLADLQFIDDRLLIDTCDVWRCKQIECWIVELNCVLTWNYLVVNYGSQLRKTNCFFLKKKKGNFLIMNFF